MKRIIGNRDFTDGSQRAVYEDDDGRQFVIDDEGRAAYGVWVLVDEPEVAMAAKSDTLAVDRRIQA